ncbi:MAG: hypothetical protein HC817_14920 [Saprospiraceae bacterium]|nr:hypothetical protein [Saprospiraceae bacterium]
MRFGFGERRFGGGCEIDDMYDNPQTKGWFFRVGNHFKLGRDVFVGPYFMYVSETNSIEDPSKVFQSRKEKTPYAGLNLDFTLFERKKWGINFNMSALYALKQQDFWGSSCNDFKMGVGSASVAPIFVNLNTMVYYRF